MSVNTLANRVGMLRARFYHYDAGLEPLFIVVDLHDDNSCPDPLLPSFDSDAPLTRLPSAFIAPTKAN